MQVPRQADSQDAFFIPFPSLLFSSLSFPSLLFPSLPFTSLPSPSLKGLQYCLDLVMVSLEKKLEVSLASLETGSYGYLQKLGDQRALGE